MSAGYGGGSVNGGINGNMSKGSSKWVSEQTSLTAGGSVDIDVAEKTTLRGAVIASDTGDLTLATGSLEYSNIKDRNSSTNFGGGASAHTGNGKTGKEKTESGKGLDSASFGFSDSRQTNFATIGEGTITVRDEASTGSATGLEGLNRDVSKAQYSTMDLGVQLSADKSTIDMLSDIKGTYAETKKQGLITYSIGEGAVKAVDTGFDSELGFMGTLEAVGNARKDVLTVVSMAENKALREKIDGALNGDAATFEGAVNEASGIVQTLDGAKEENISHVTLYQGDVVDNDMSGYKACYDKDLNITYLNTQGTDLSRGGDIMNSIFTEAQRKDNTTNGLGLNYNQQTALAYSRGEQAETLWNRFSETANKNLNAIGASYWNSNNATSSTLTTGTTMAQNNVNANNRDVVVPRRIEWNGSNYIYKADNKVDKIIYTTLGAVPFGTLQTKALDTAYGTIYLGERDLTIEKTSLDVLSMVDKIAPYASTTVRGIATGAGLMNLGFTVYDANKVKTFEVDKVEIGVEQLVGLRGQDKDFIIFASKYAEKRINGLLQSRKVIIDDVNHYTGNAGTIMYDSNEINQLRDEIKIMEENWKNRNTKK